jgi:hypothetical protein
MIEQLHVVCHSADKWLHVLVGPTSRVFVLSHRLAVVLLLSVSPLLAQHPPLAISERGVEHGGAGHAGSSQAVAKPPSAAVY